MNPELFGRPNRVIVWGARIAIVAAALLCWEELPKIGTIHRSVTFADPFFISSPSRIAHELWLLMSGAPNVPTIWSAIARTILTSLVGTGLACVVGSIAGLAVANWALFGEIARPFVVLLNAIPRIAIIPIVVLVVGASVKADAITAFTVVFFLVFYNAAEGAASVPVEIIQSAELMGASKFRVMWKVRWPYALGWTMVTLPNAIAFGLVGTVTSEIFTAGGGLGYQLTLAIDNANATLLFSMAVLLAVLGVILVLGTSWLRAFLLPWWESSQGL